MGRIQKYRRGRRSKELRIAVQVSLDIHPRVSLAWASNVRWIHIIEPIKAEVTTTIVVVV